MSTTDTPLPTPAPMTVSGFVRRMQGIRAGLPPHRAATPVPLAVPPTFNGAVKAARDAARALRRWVSE